MRPLIPATLFSLVCVSLVCAVSVQAQEVYPKLEVFGGYAANKFFYTNSDLETLPANIASLFDVGHDRHYGFDAAFTRNFSRYLGIAAEFWMYPTTETGSTGTVRISATERPIAFALGPELKLRNGTRWTPFAQALVGVAYSSADFHLDTSNGSVSQFHSRTGLAMAVGGGLEFLLAPRVSLRGMVDYAPTFLGAADPEDSSRQNNIRYGLGLLFHFR